MKILLIRHGETDGNANRVVQRPELPLSRRGQEQARRLAERLSGEGIVRILSSDLRRAEMTAEALRVSTGVAIEFEPLLQERNYGDIRGTPYAELGDINIFDDAYAPPGGETGAVFHARVDAAWARVREVADEIEGDLAVVTHGLVCHSLASRYLDLQAADVPIGWSNTSLTIIEGRPPFGVRLLNCTAHLEGEGSPDPAPGARA